jgi:hypothetical protein
MKQRISTKRWSVFILGLTLTVAAHAAPTEAEVGDPDSFGRNVIYLGLAQTATVTLQEDCTPDPNDPPPPQDRCVTLNPQPAATSFNAENLDTIQLPAAATNSLLCFALSPSATFSLNNLTGVQQPNARFTARALITIENEVLNDPALIDPNTGQPYGGRMTLSIGTYSESRSIDVNERQQQTFMFSRDCVGGLVSKSSLIASGLSPTQAILFFAKPMKLTFGSQGTAQIVDFASYFYGIRLYGDR